MSFCSKFLSYDFAKYYLNWFTVGNVITKIKRVNFSLRHSVDCPWQKSILAASISKGTTKTLKSQHKLELKWCLNLRQHLTAKQTFTENNKLNDMELSSCIIAAVCSAVGWYHLEDDQRRTTNDISLRITNVSDCRVWWMLKCPLDWSNYITSAGHDGRIAWKFCIWLSNHEQSYK